MTFKDRLRELRTIQGLTQDELGRSIGYGRSAIANYESGRSEPSYDILEKISNRLNVSIDYLLGRDDTREQNQKSKFNGSNIDLIRGDMSYEELSNNISLKLDNPKIKEFLSSAFIEKISKGKINPSPEVIEILAVYAGVSADFMYKSNSLQELILAQEKFSQQKKHNTILYDKETDEFIRNPDNLKYILYAKKLKDKGVDPENILNYTIRMD